jgi:carboxypeptidase PM20D1
MIRLIAAASAVVLAVLAGYIGYRTLTFTAPVTSSAGSAPDTRAFSVNVSSAALHLSEAIQFRTISLTRATGDRAEFERLHAWMQTRYPAFHAATQREVISDLSLLYTWAGSDPAQPPMLFLAHQDVVPVPDETRAAWRVDPFAGVIQEDAVWGRGAMDDKGSLVALLEAAETLAASGRRPTRTIMFAFGHDEEIGSPDGAQRIAALLHQRGVRAWFVIDEGMAAINPHPITGAPVAMIGISERGAGILRVRAESTPGHASMPGRETAVSLIAEAVDRIHAMPIEHRLEGGPALDMMRALAPELSLTSRVAVANEWLFGPMIRAQFSSNPAADALLGTTVAPTVIRGGDNVGILPSEAQALINFRIHPRDTAEGLLRQAQDAVAGLEGVTVEWASPPLPATAVSSTTSSSYALIANVSRAVMPEAAVAPGLVLAGTDARHYADVAENVYRYQPILLSVEDLDMPHGVNERMTLANYERMIRFYIGLMEAGAMP